MSVWVRAELEDVVIFPKDDGSFDLDSSVRYRALIVEGQILVESSSSRDDAAATPRGSPCWAHGASKRRKVDDLDQQKIIDELKDLEAASQDITSKVSSLITLLHASAHTRQVQVSPGLGT